MKATVGMQVKGYAEVKRGNRGTTQIWSFGTVVEVNEQEQSIVVHVTQVIGKPSEAVKPWTLEFDKDVVYTFCRTNAKGREFYESEGDKFGTIRIR